MHRRRETLLTMHAVFHMGTASACCRVTQRQLLSRGAMRFLRARSESVLSSAVAQGQWRVERAAILHRVNLTIPFVDDFANACGCARCVCARVRHFRSTVTRNSKRLSAARIQTNWWKDPSPSCYRCSCALCCTLSVIRGAHLGGRMGRLWFGDCQAPIDTLG